MKTKKDFSAMAESIREIKNSAARNRRIEECIAFFKKNNPRFNADKFRASCDPKQQDTDPLPPGISYQYQVRVDTSEWFPDIRSQFDELWKVTYKGATYNLHWESEDCRCTNHYPKNHAWAGQVESHTLDMRHVFEQFVGRKPTYACGKTETATPGCRLMDFLCDFLFNVEGCEDIEGCTAYCCDMTFTVDIEKKSVFEKSLKQIAKVLRGIKYEFEKDMPPSED